MASLFWFDGTVRDIHSGPSDPLFEAKTSQCQIRGCSQPSASNFNNFCALHSCPSLGCPKPLIYKNKEWCEDHGCPIPGCKNDFECVDHRCPGIFEHRGCQNFLIEGQSFCYRHQCPSYILGGESCKNSVICPDHSCMVLGCGRVSSVRGRGVCDEHIK